MSWQSGQGYRQRRAPSCPFPARESEAVSKSSPRDICLNGIGVKAFHAQDRQYGNAHQLCLLFPVPGHNAVFPGMRLSGHHSGNAKAPWGLSVFPCLDSRLFLVSLAALLVLQTEQAKGQTPGDEAWPLAIGRKAAADKGSGSAATGRMRVRGLMGIRTRSGTCRTRHDQCCSGLPAGCSSRPRSCCRCQIQDQRHLAR